jgi:cyclophilin family peptidyl-prolyl cis-trans isomerase
MRRFTLFRVSAVLICAALTAASFAQEAAAPAKPVDDVKEKFAAELAVCDKLRKEALAIREKIAEAAPDARKPLIDEYLKAIEKTRAAMKPLGAAAEAAYKAAPNDDDKVTSVLLGLALEKISEDRMEEAMPTLNLLKDSNCDKKELHCLLGAAAYCRDDFQTAEKELKVADEAGVIDLVPLASRWLTDCTDAQKALAEELKKREAEAKADDLPRVRMETSKGTLVLELYENEAPDTVGNFISLVEKEFYNGLTFHRVIGNFMAQGGCPHGTGEGGPGYTIYCECEKPEHRNHFRGTLSMAKEDAKDTGGSQFFVTFVRTSHLDGKHTVFGRVIEGLDVLEKLQRNPNAAAGAKPDVIVKAEVLRKRNHPYAPKKVEEKGK